MSVALVRMARGVIADMHLMFIYYLMITFVYVHTGKVSRALHVYYMYMHTQQSIPLSQLASYKIEEPPIELPFPHNRMDHSAV